MNITKTRLSAIVVFENFRGIFMPAFMLPDEISLFETGKIKPDSDFVVAPGGTIKSLITRDILSGITQLLNENKIFKPWFMT
jgi:hypothetical protein